MEEDRQLELELEHGSMDYMSFRLQYRRHEGWNVFFNHRHDGESMLCPSKGRYDGLTLVEAIDVLEAILAHAHDRFKVTRAGCSPV